MKIAAWKAFLVLGFLLTFGSGADPQTPDSNASNPKNNARQKTNIQQIIRVNSNLVVLSVLVKDGDGNLVSGLGGEDFRLYDDGVEQKIDAFSEEALPLSLVILVDQDLKEKPGLELTKSLRAIVGGVSTQDEVSVSRFDMLFYPGDEFTSDQGRLLAALRDVQTAATPAPTFIPQPVTCGNSTSGPPCIRAPVNLGARPSKALDDALWGAAQMLALRNKDRRKMILLLSDGSNEPKLNHHEYEEVLAMLLQENISVFAVAVGSDSTSKRYARLASYAHSSGGEIYYAAKAGAMEQLYSRITEEARHSYTLAYIPNGNNAGSTYHKIEIRMGEGFSAQTREGYYTTQTRPPKN
jgi:Ca-activated chloride channel homolog